MIELFEQDVKTFDRQSSKGNQLKWHSQGFWYKADYTGYEGLSEYVVSALLRKSSLKDTEYVSYFPEQIRYKSQIYNGAKSADFLDEKWQIITLERLFQQHFSQSLTNALWKISGVEERFQFLVSQVRRITGLSDFDIYLNKLFTIDAFFLNEDRHMHNIAVLMNAQGDFRYCPFFDHGAALLADTTMDYPLGTDTVNAASAVKSKSISTSFDEQLDASEKICGQNLSFSFSKKEVSQIISSADVYPAQVRQRVEDVIFLQMRKYQYLFEEAM